MSFFFTNSAGFSGNSHKGVPSDFFSICREGSNFSRFSIWQIRAASSWSLASLLPRKTVFLVKASRLLMTLTPMDSSLSLPMVRSSISPSTSARRTCSAWSLRSKSLISSRDWSFMAVSYWNLLSRFPSFSFARGYALSSGMFSNSAAISSMLIKAPAFLARPFSKGDAPVSRSRSVESEVVVSANIDLPFGLTCLSTGMP
mmetsp:Transcript_40144/g.95931  ORF Transcript_40144/g.95931 Transcript_40144/m.95931 type:complete len:201 (-) Transcript_40144:66-668(-)